MKSFLVVVVLCSALAFVQAAPAPAVETKGEKALRECNATIPVQRNPRIIVAEGIAAAKPFHLSQEEMCFLHCHLQKVGFFDENADIKDGKELIKYTLKKQPGIANYSDVIIASIFQIVRSTQGFDNKCLKAFITYHQFATTVFELEIAEGLESATGVRDKIVNSIQTGQSVNKEIENDVKSFLGFLDLLLTALAQDPIGAQQLTRATI